MVQMVNMVNRQVKAEQGIIAVMVEPADMVGMGVKAETEAMEMAAKMRRMVKMERMVKMVQMVTLLRMI